MNIENGAKYGLEILKKELGYEKIRNKKIVIFGFNNGAKLCIYYLHSLLITPIAIVDNDKKIREDRRYYFGIPICAPEDVLKEIKDDVLIVILARREKEIRECVLAINLCLEEKMVSFYLQDITKMFQPWKIEDNCRFVDLRMGQLELLRMMKALHMFCEERNIKYMLAYGTLLGAIRHKGFIPWDDDMDIYMPWDDYLRFCNAIEKEKLFSYNCSFCESSKLRTISTLTQIVSDKIYSEYYNFPLRTSQGVTIDVWPLVEFPNDINEQKEYEHELIETGDAWKEFVVMGFGSERYDREKHISMIEHLYETMNRYNGCESLYLGEGYCGMLEDPLREGRVIRKELCDRRLLVEFEDTKLWVPDGYDEILTSIYGDYMQLPNKEEQMPMTYASMYMKED